MGQFPLESTELSPVGMKALAAPYLKMVVFIVMKRLVAFLKELKHLVVYVMEI